MFKVLLIAIFFSLCGNSSAGENPLSSVESLQYEILNNDNIGKLEINYIYNKLLTIIDDIRVEDEPLQIIYLDFEYIVEYIEELLSRDIKKSEIKGVWDYMLENNTESKKQLIEGRNRIIKSLL